MIDVPVVKAFTIPDIEPIVATVILLLVHDPPAEASVRVVVCPLHNEAEPLIAESAVTVTIVFILQVGPMK